MTTILACIFVFGLIITAHELGHFCMAKVMGMHVKEFAIGFGPKLVQEQIGETMYTIRALPLGGYNNIAGMDVDEPDPRGFYKKPIWARMLVILSGSCMNLLLCISMFFFSFVFNGIEVPSNTATIGQVIRDSPASMAGLKEGDVILVIDNEPTNTWEDVVKSISHGKIDGMKFFILRGVDQYEIEVTPQIHETTRRPYIGVVGATKHQDLSIKESVEGAVTITKQMLVKMYDGMVHLFTGKENVRLSGPIGIASMAGDFAEQGFNSLLQFTAILSLNLGFLNVLPLPALDGGHFILLVMEAVTGKRPTQKILQKIQIIGVAMIITLLVVATFNDVFG